MTKFKWLLITCLLAFPVSAQTQTDELGITRRFYAVEHIGVFFSDKAKQKEFQRRLPFMANAEIVQLLKIVSKIEREIDEQGAK